MGELFTLKTFSLDPKVKQFTNSQYNFARSLFKGLLLEYRLEIQHEPVQYTSKLQIPRATLLPYILLLRAIMRQAKLILRI